MAQQHPPFPHKPPERQYVTHIWAYGVLKVDAALSRLVALQRATARRPGKAAADTADAISLAASLAHEELHKLSMKARHGGELLFCWHGTQATRIGQDGAA